MTESRESSEILTASRFRLALLLLAYTATCCLSFVYVIKLYSGYGLLSFDAALIYASILNVTPLALAAVLFAFSRFSFGYLIGFPLYTMILGYLWLAKFSQLDYDHTLGGISAFISVMAFLAPALFVTAPVRQRIVLSEAALEYLLWFILFFAASVLAVGASYNFRLENLADIYRFRVQIDFPGPLRYAIGITANALLPFAFACFYLRGDRLRAAASLLLLLSFYPITLTKTALFGPFWLIFLALLSRFVEARLVVIISLFVILLGGVLLLPLMAYGAISSSRFIGYFGAVNFRIFAVPSIALDIYGHFFSRNSLTHFCQISFLKSFVDCPYSEYLSVIMSRNYQLGNANASFFATEGIASVGPKLAPLSAFACGLVVALANRLSSGLSPILILLSGGMLSQVFLNVPLTTSLLTNGAALTFLLWYITPRGIFGRAATRSQCETSPTIVS
jgi:hypothetical protein